MSLLDKVLSRQPSRTEFAQKIIRAFREAGIEQVEPSESEFSLKLGGGSTVFLSNVYANYCRVKRSLRETVISEFVTAAASIPALPVIPSDFAMVKPSLMPVLRDAASFSIESLMNRKNGRGAAPSVPPFGGGDLVTVDPGMGELTKPLAGGLVVGLAYDTEHTITSIDRDHFEKWGISLEEAFKAAKDNLWEKTDPGRFAGEGGVYSGEWHDSYDSSRMLLTEVIYRLSVDGDPVAFVPNRDQLWVTGTNNLAGLTALLKAGAESHFKQGHPLSPDLYVLLDGTWKLYVPEDQSLRNLLLPLKRQRDAIDYSQQQGLLNDIHKLEEIDLFVASYKIFEREDGSSYSACIWSNGIDSLLPQAENIAFLVDLEGKDHFVVPWDAAVSVVGSLLEQEPSLMPIRYRVRQFPNAEQLIELRKFAV
ncbi:MAG: hypothetical protein WCC89_13825 [Candidatus Sulfotelmatobacter sp.]